MNRKQRRAAAKLGETPSRPPAATPATGVSTAAAGFLETGIKHHQAGQLAEAEACYRRVLAAQPEHADALHLLGVIAYQARHHDVAVALISQAIRQNERNPFYFANLGNALQDQGRLDEAIAAYRQATIIKPDLAEAHSNLGNALRSQGKLDEAIAAYRQAIGLKPDYAEAHSNLGTALRDQGKLDEAIAACRRAIDLKPHNAEAHCNFGNVLRDQGKLEQAIAAYRRATGLKPDFAEAHSNLGTALRDRGELDAAIAAYRQAIGSKPDYAEAHSNLGIALQDQGRLDEAIAAYSQAVIIKPGFVEVHFNLGNVLRSRGRLDEAIAAYRQAIQIKPDLAAPHSNLGNALQAQGKLDEAIAAYRQALQIKPDLAAAHSNLGNALQAQGRLDEAIAAYRQAIDSRPDFAEARSNLAGALLDQGRLDEAIATWRHAIGIKPDHAEAFSNLLFCLNYHDQLTADDLFAAHREWDARFGRPVARPSAFANDRETGRRLRIGYVSPDFRSHSVAFFIAPLLEGHDRQAVEVFCYAEVLQPDLVTSHLQGLADHWLVTVGLPDDALAERIRGDGIDILVDLAGHTAKNRLGVFARKPAPVQVTWLGYPNTTGLEAIDYRLVDAVTDPIGAADAWASETLVRLDGGFLCYGGLQDAPEPAPPPSLKTGTVTFGSFNNPSKLSAATFDAWARLLIRLPDARLLLKGKSFADAGTRALFLAKLGERGVAAERVELAAQLPNPAEHLALYDRIDIALDPFPYNGTTTTCEALWMGVPVVTLRGDRHAGRVGASLLGQVGLADLIADSVDEYVEIAGALAGDPARLADLRRSLRGRLAASQLCDTAAFIRKIETAFRTMWQRWCEAPLAAAAFIEAGLDHHHAGRLPEAEACYRRALAAQPEHPDALHLLGVIAHQMKQHDVAVELISQAIKQNGGNPFYFSNLGNALRDLGKLDAAVASYCQAIAGKPDFAEAHSNLGNALRDRGRLDEAIAAYRQAIGLNPDYAEAHSNLANALRDQGKLDEAIAAYRQAIDLKPDYAEAHSNLANALRDQGKLDEAVAASGRAIDLKPDYAKARSNLAVTLQEQGKLDAAIAAYRQAIASKPDFAEASSNLLFCLNYHDQLTAEHVFAEHREWGARFGRQAPRPSAYANDRSKGRRLRIGYVSPDFRLHSVAYFIGPLLHGHDRQAVEVFCYAEVLRPDIVTSQLQQHADRWLVTVGLSDDELAERIRGDGIDILVDLAGHTAKNRLGVFARKPAPVQVTWLGYSNTTGLEAIDYRLVDAVTDPIGAADALASETLVRLDGGFLCYGKLQDAPEPAPPPSLKTGMVTFGSFNNPSKLSAATFDAWARLLIRLPDARLLLKGKSFADAGTRALFLSKLGERGVAAERVELAAQLPNPAEHLALYDRIDIALDPFPYNGTTTTCEALWMGVPVVTLRGDRHAGRVGASLLGQVGLADLIASSVDEYVEIALALAGDRERLFDLHRSLRPRMAASPLCDGHAFARKIEAAFRDMWQRWCDAPGSR